jgi:FkbM family methyltransferase
MAFYGLDQLDARIAEHVTAPIGTFVELGAYDGITQNNTLHFEEKGWRGVLVEPLPTVFEACRRNRPLAKVFHCACVPHGFPQADVEMISVGLMSLRRGSIDGAEREEEWIKRGETVQQLTREQVRVPARTLDSILDEACVSAVDLLVVDVEGAELDVLAGFDLARWQPEFVVCEDAYDRKVARLMSCAGYEMCVLLERKFTRDVLYRRTKLADPSLYRQIDKQ